MLVWMTGELDYVDVLHPKKEEIHLLKHKDVNNQPHYVGDSQKTDDFLQFAGMYVNRILANSVHIPKSLKFCKSSINCNVNF